MWHGDEKKALLVKDFQDCAVFIVQEQGKIKFTVAGQFYSPFPAVFSYQMLPVRKVFKVHKYRLIWKHPIMLFCSTFLS